MSGVVGSQFEAVNQVARDRTVAGRGSEKVNPRHLNSRPAIGIR